MEDKIDLRWRKSSYSGNGGGNCVEVAAGGRVLVRDSQDRVGTVVLRFPPVAWRRFADQVKRSLALDILGVSRRINGSACLPGCRRCGHWVHAPCPGHMCRANRCGVFGEERVWETRS